MDKKPLQQNIWELKGSALNRQLRRAQAVKHLFRDSRLKLILDVGCAEGFVASFLAGERTHVVGIDLDESIKIAEEKVKDADFIRASITHLPFRGKCFEAVTLLEVLEHLKDSSLRDGIKEVDRVLKYGGCSANQRAIQRKNNLHPMHTLRKIHTFMGASTLNGRVKSDQPLTRSLHSYF